MNRDPIMVKESNGYGTEGSVLKEGNLEKIKKSLWIVTGSISLGLGTVGIVVPLLPTTPFLLGASYCYCRGSRRLDRWLLNNKYLGKYIKNYREGKGLSLGNKVFTMSLLWVVILFSAFFVIDIQIAQVILIMIAIGVSLHLVRIPTYTRG